MGNWAWIWKIGGGGRRHCGMDMDGMGMDGMGDGNGNGNWVALDGGMNERGRWQAGLRPSPPDRFDLSRRKLSFMLNNSYEELPGRREARCLEPPAWFAGCGYRRRTGRQSKAGCVRFWNFNEVISDEYLQFVRNVTERVELPKRPGTRGTRG